jgi:16S rRNA (cytidine1402-2'-O)-methyltransferase
MSEVSAGALYLVATPIGNLGDLSRRAEACLRGVQRVLAEDTRRTRALLSHLQIQGTPVDRFDAHACPEAIHRALEALGRGEALALVTDAGTPSVSDPGAALARAAVEAGFVVVPIPGASAVLAALAGAALGDGAFRFLGFLPRERSPRDAVLEQVTGTSEVVVLFESPHRLGETLAELAALQPGRSAVVARELTKIHEEFTRGTLAELASLERVWQGEIVLVLGPFECPAEAAPEAQIEGWIDEALARGASAREAAQQVAARSGLPRREVYARVLARKARTAG